MENEVEIIYDKYWNDFEVAGRAIIDLESLVSHYLKNGKTVKFIVKNKLRYKRVKPVVSLKQP